MEFSSLINLNGLQKFLEQIEIQVKLFSEKLSSHEIILSSKANDIQIRDMDRTLCEVKQKFNNDLEVKHKALSSLRDDTISSLTDIKQEFAQILNDIYTKTETHKYFEEELEKFALKIVVEKVSKKEWTVLREETINVLNKTKEIENRLCSKLDRTEIVDLKEADAKVKSLKEAVDILVTCKTRFDAALTKNSEDIMSQKKSVSIVSERFESLQTEVKSRLQQVLVEEKVSRKDIDDINLRIHKLSKEIQNVWDHMKQVKFLERIENLEGKSLVFEAEISQVENARSKFSCDVDDQLSRVSALNERVAALEAKLLEQNQLTSTHQKELQRMGLALAEQTLKAEMLEKKATLSVRFMAWFAKTQDTDILSAEGM